MSIALEDLKGIFDAELIKSIKHQAPGLWSSKRLFDCMSYALSSPGKRLRPLLVLSSALTVATKQSALIAVRKAMPAALAVEYVHTYSLIHDDLPAMDNDDFRRGRLSAHRQFDEALAILAGDALLADAFLLALDSPNNPTKIARELALAAGSAALVAGQAEDLNNHHRKDLAQWLLINQAKTARLFEAAAVMGGLSLQASAGEIAALRAFGQAFGQAFQIKDDTEDNQGLSLTAKKTTIQHLKMSALDKAQTSASTLDNPHLLISLLHLTFTSAV